ncbi:MAG TPA: zinc ribbon domain-containing protein [Ktedonobacteraceae bacterium]|nr:zinc ribbon domain-containing protein [Ktedonobacteraceae bacterium]
MKRPANFRYYSRKKLLALFIGYIVNLLLVIVPLALFASGSAGDTLNAVLNIGVFLFIVQALFVMAYDWRGAITLRGWTGGRVARESLLADFNILYVILYLFFPEVMLPIYLFRIVAGRREIEAQRRLERQRYIAAMEARLGILPPTSGTCRACHKPLQVGADFCQYCGIPVVEQPKVCPACATTALPDARWCPKCGGALG